MFASNQWQSYAGNKTIVLYLNLFYNKSNIDELELANFKPKQHNEKEFFVSLNFNALNKCILICKCAWNEWMELSPQKIPITESKDYFTIAKMHVNYAINMYIVKTFPISINFVQ